MKNYPKHWHKVEITEQLCDECSDPILEGEGRYRLPSGTYHPECYEEMVSSGKLTLPSVESMIFDKRITA